MTSACRPTHHSTEKQQGTDHGFPQDFFFCKASLFLPTSKLRHQSCTRFSGPLGRCRATQGLAEKRRALSEPRSGELRSPRQGRVAQGTGRSPAPTRGRLLLWLLSSWRNKKKVRPRVRRGILGPHTRFPLHLDIPNGYTYDYGMTMRFLQHP